jgi:hypothetical protein
VVTLYAARVSFVVHGELMVVTFPATLGITVVVSVNFWLVGAQRSEPSAVEHGLLLLVGLHALLEGAPLVPHVVLEERHLLVVSGVQDF